MNIIIASKPEATSTRLAASAVCRARDVMPASVRYIV